MTQKLSFLKNNSQRNEYSRILGWILVLFYISSLETITMLQYTPLSGLFRLARFVSYGLLGLMALWNLPLDWSSVQGWIGSVFRFLLDYPLYTLSLLLSVAASLATRGIEPLVILLLLSAVWKESFSFLARISLLALAGFFAGIVLLSCTGLIENVEFFRNGNSRFALGFIYPLECHSLFVFIVLLYVYVFWNRYDWKQCLLLNGANLLLFLFTRARFSLVLIIGFSLLALVLHSRLEQPIRTLLAKKGMLVAAALFVAALFLVPNLLASHFEHVRWMDILDTLVSDRLELGHTAYVQEGLSWFGKYIVWTGFGGVGDLEEILEIETRYNYVDCSYMKNLFDYGILYFVLEYAAYTYILLHTMKQGNLAGFACVLLVLGLGLFEARLLQVSMNPFLMLASSGLMLKNPAWQKKERMQHA